MFTHGIYTKQQNELGLHQGIDCVSLRHVGTKVRVGLAVPGSLTLGGLFLNLGIPKLTVSTNFITDFLLIDIVKVGMKLKEVHA